jgi:multidrug efflux pump subunit AcrA (membrane-fusion protein)
MLRIVDTSNVEASIRAPLSAMPFMENGMSVTVKHTSFEKVQQIRTIVPVGNALSRMMEVRVSLTSGDFAIGSAVRVALPHSEYYQAMTVPRDALVLRKAGTFVYLVDKGNVAHQIPVETGIGVGRRIEVRGQLEDDMPVVIRGAERLRSGQKVRYELTGEIAKRS